MSDWQTMNAGPELDRLIAEQLGWTMGSIVGDLRPRHVRHQLINPSGKPVAYCNDDDGWVALGGFVPHYSTDLNAAWDALGILKANIEITIKNGRDGRLLIAFWDNVWHSDYSGPPALAICRALLDWMEAKEKAI